MIVDIFICLIMNVFGIFLIHKETGFEKIEFLNAIHSILSNLMIFT